MIRIERIETMGWKHAIHGMRNPMNSWARSDSEFENVDYYSSNERDILEHRIGNNDRELMRKLARGGADDRKFMRMITVYMDITAPLYFWKEFDTYKVGTVANSCSTMHKIAEKRFTREDFSCEHLSNTIDKPIPEIDMTNHHWMAMLDNVIATINVARDRYLETGRKEYWWQMIQLLPSSYNQKRTVMLNYEVLRNMHTARKNHKLDEWREFCETIEKELPMSELVIGKM